MRRGQAGDGGFATVTATALCAGLAVVSVALVDLAFSSAKRAQEAVRREEAHQALRSVIEEAIAVLANQPGAGLGQSVKQYGPLAIEVTVANELERPNVYTASEAQIAAALESVTSVNATEVAATIAAARLAPGSERAPLPDFLLQLGVEHTSILCLQEKLTVHASAVDPFASGNTNPPAKDGAILNFRARIIGDRAPDLTRESVVVFTGDRQAPLRRLGDRTFRTSLIGECVDDKA